VLTILVLSQGAGLVLLLALAGQPAPPVEAVLIAAGAGLAEMVGFAALYRSLAIGPMSVVAPLASLAAVVPIAAGVAGGERPEPRDDEHHRRHRRSWPPSSCASARARCRPSAWRECWSVSAW